MTRRRSIRLALRVAEAASADHRAAPVVVRRRRRHDVLVDAGRDRHRLHRRARLERPRHRAVAKRLGIGDGDARRIERRPRREREDRAVARIQDDDRSAGRFLSLDRATQHALGRGLDLEVDREHEVRAVLRRDRGPKADRELAVLRIALDGEAPGDPAQQLVVRALDAVLTEAVVVHESEQLRRERVVRIHALGLRLEAEARDRRALRPRARPARAGAASDTATPRRSRAPRGSSRPAWRGSARASRPPRRGRGCASGSRTGSAGRPSSRGPGRSGRGSHRAAPRRRGRSAADSSRPRAAPRVRSSASSRREATASSVAMAKSANRTRRRVGEIPSVTLPP